GIGLSRDFIVANSSDGIISVGGGVGTLIELCVGYMTRKPMVSIRNSGGVSDMYGGKFLDERNRILIEAVKDPTEAVDSIISKISSKKNLEK
ncbi:MAG: TIGR00725 family protein, partial [Thermoproteota archaeon]|nr:TIGR00725 family protein [Thermoproteota archaeon]